tara:strand:- start:1160 stop:1732 length:573 start_codon:yes stop_codon:yes gene_type:complete
MNKYIFASSNKNKILELSHRLPTIDIVSLEDIGYTQEIIETGLTIEENAIIKARTIYNIYREPCISDDTALEVDALQGRPGVFSARYGGVNSNAKNNIKKLIQDMHDVNNRRASFRTIICLIQNNQEKLFEGVVNGVITTKVYGDKGFGYDPVFIPDGYQKTFAQISLTEKNQISHRAQAINKLVKYLSF